MYRIRLGNGEEAVYRSLEELTLAVHTGVVSPKADVFHNTANRWLPIELHPDYRAALVGRRPSAPHAKMATPAPQVDDPLHSPPGGQPRSSGAIHLMRLADDPPRTPVVPSRRSGAVHPPRQVEGLVHSALDSVGSAPVALPVQVFETPSELPPVPNLLARAKRSRRRRTRQAATAAATSIAAVAVALFLAWRTALPRLERQPVGHFLSAGMAEPPVPEFEPRAFVDTSYPAPSPPLPMSAGSDSAAVAGVTRTSRLRATLNRAPTYYEAYADSRAEMDDALAYIRFGQVFESSRFASPESLRATRRMVSAAGNILRVYRGREVMLEQNYRPDDPGGKGTLRERFETAEATRALLSDVDSLFGLLLAQQGRFVYAGESLRFQDGRSARNYTDLRGSIVAALRTWRDSTGAPDLVTMPRLIRAFGDRLPPPAR